MQLASLKRLRAVCAAAAADLGGRKAAADLNMAGKLLQTPKTGFCLAPPHRLLMDPDRGVA